MVNVLTPAYNGEKYVHRLLESILCQTYPYISMIVINDGSTDETEYVINSYVERFKKKGYSLTLYSQVNGGVSNAINNGLKYVDGDYLVWPDIDDWYSSPYCIEKLVEAIERYGDEVGVARSSYNRVSENNLSELVPVIHNGLDAEPHDLFEDAVMQTNKFWFGGYMIKTKFLDSFIPNRVIFQTRYGGQNCQLLWPYLYYTKCVTVDEPLIAILSRNNSHCRGLLQSIEKKLQQQDDYMKTYEMVLNGIPELSEDQKNKYLKVLSSEILWRKRNLCLSAGRYRLAYLYHRNFLNKTKPITLRKILGFPFRLVVSVMKNLFVKK